MHVEPIRRTMIRVPVRFGSPASISSGRPSSFVDSEMVRDGAGRVIVPGSALAGAIASRLRRSGQPHPIAHAWGSDQEGTRASRISIPDAVVSETRSSARHGVGIDRVTGSAKTGLLFEREVLPAGAAFDVLITVDDADDDALRSAALACGALRNADIQLGGRTSTGLGRIEASLDEAEARLVTLDSPAAIADEVLRRLSRTSEGWSPLADVLDIPDADQAGLHPRTVHVRIPWTPLRHILVASSNRSAATDAMPLAETHDGRIVLPIPGTTLKGVLRSHAERLMRTALDLDADSDELAERPLHEQVDVPIVSHMFGISGNSSEGGGEQDRNRRGAIVVHETPSTWSCSSDQWDAVMQAATPDELHRALADAGLEHGTIEFHIAIDRWLGGVADYRLFDNLALHGVDWQAIDLSIDLDRLDEEVDVALLIHVLQWAAAGWTPIGSRSRVGVGDFQLTSDIDITWPDGTVVKISAESPGALVGPDDWLAGLRERWGRRLDRLAELVAEARSAVGGASA